MRILVCGGRDWQNLDLIRNTLGEFTGLTIIEGGARGADIMSGYIASEFGWGLLVYHAQWNKLGRSAGAQRNERMINEGLPDLVIAFHNDIEHSSGTADMLQRAEKHSIPYALVTEEDIDGYS